MNRVEVGCKLLHLRGERSRIEVANANGISVSALQMYENGQRIPRDEVKLRLARYYQISIEHLFFEDEVHVS